MLEISVQILRIGGPRWYPQIRLMWRTDYENTMTFKIYRGFTEETLELIHTYVGTAGTKDYTWDDAFDVTIPDLNNVRLGNRFRNYFYKIESYLPNGNLREESETVSWRAGMYTRYELEIMRGHEHYFTKFSGTPFFHFKRKVLQGAGKHCPECWDPSLGRARTEFKASTCELCLGTGIVSPYHDPVEAWIRIKSPEQDNQDAAKLAKKYSMEKIVCDANGVPLVHPGDILMDVIDMTFYEVDKVDHVGKRHSGVLQNLAAKEMVREKPEYRWLQVAADANKDVIDELIRQSKERRF